MSASEPSGYTSTQVRVRTVGLAAVTAVAHFRTGNVVRHVRAGPGGRASITYKVGGAQPDYKVKVTVTVRRAGRSGSCSTSFTPAWMAYVLSQSTLTPINALTDKAGTPIKGVGGPAMAVTPNGKFAYVMAGGGAIPVDIATRRVGTPILVIPPNPIAIGMLPNGKTVYVVSDIADTVTPISTATNKADLPLIVGIGGHEFANAIAFAPDSKTGYVAVSGGNVRAIDTTSNTGGAAFPVNGDPVAVAVNPDGKSGYAASEGNNTLTPFSTATNTAGNPIIGPGGSSIVFTPNGKTAYVASSGGYVVAINTTTNKVAAIIKLGLNEGSLPYLDMAVAPNGKTVYAISTEQNSVSYVVPISTATNKAGKPIKVGRRPSAIAVTPDGRTLFVVNGLDTVTPISTATNKPGVPIRVGSGPDWIAIAP